MDSKETERVNKIHSEITETLDAISPSLEGRGYTLVIWPKDEDDEIRLSGNVCAACLAGQLHRLADVVQEETTTAVIRCDTKAGMH